MNKELVVVLCQEGGKFLSEAIKVFALNRRNARVYPQRPVTIEAPATHQDNQAAPPVSEDNVATGCVPCAIGHFSTCTGLLNEAMRFARKDGIEDDEPLLRVHKCLDELNALERVDLTSEKIVYLPAPIKELAEESLNLSRATRHELENLSSVDQLEKVTATMQTKRNMIGVEWTKRRLKALSPNEKIRIVDSALDKVERAEGKN